MKRIYIAIMFIFLCIHCFNDQAEKDRKKMEYFLCQILAVETTDRTDSQTAVAKTLSCVFKYVEAFQENPSVFDRIYGE